MKSKRSGSTGKPVGKRAVKDLPGKQGGKRAAKDLTPKKTSDVKGGSRVMANAHEMKKALIGNLPR